MLIFQISTIFQELRFYNIIECNLHYPDLKYPGNAFKCDDGPAIIGLSNWRYFYS